LLTDFLPIIVPTPVRAKSDTGCQIMHAELCYYIQLLR
jgi:hypothetical protein